MDAHKFECSICFSLLLEPVVSACGHDFCKTCLHAWVASLCGRAVVCPLCRATLPDINSLRVCIRLQYTIEALFPEQLEARKKEASQELPPEPPQSLSQHSPVSLPSQTWNAFSFLHSGLRQISLHQAGPGSLSAPPAAAAAMQLQDRPEMSSAGARQEHPQTTSTSVGTYQEYLHSTSILTTPQEVSPSPQPSGWSFPNVSFTMGWYQPTKRKRRQARTPIRTPMSH
jgi:hypothetical protein